MSKAVLDVGNCGPDHGAISRLLEANFHVEVVQTHGLQDTLDALRNRAFDLVLINRIMDGDGSEGLDIIKRIKADAELASVPVMMITNYSEHQDAAVDVGAEQGFGKSDLGDPATLNKLSSLLGE